jgi:hypothetical protein
MGPLFPPSRREATTNPEVGVDVRIAEKQERRALHAVAALLGAAAMAASAGAARAQTWNLHTVIDPPVLPDVDPSDRMGFGAAVSVGANPWLVVGAPKADCPNPAAGGVVADAGRIFIYKRTNGAWAYHQSFCASTPVQNARYGGALDMSQSWMIVGGPPASSGLPGAVEIFRLDTATQQWTRQLTAVGAIDSYLGESVAIDRGLAVAGESGHDTRRGRIRTWKLSGTTITAQPHYAPAGLAVDDRYGRRVAVQSNGCELPACTSFTDVAVALGGSHANGTKVYVARRNSSTWQASQVLQPPVGAEFNWNGGLDVSHYQVVATMNVVTASRQIGCPVGRAVRVYYRSGGTFASLGDACPAPTDGQATFGHAVAADRGTTWFHASSPDITVAATEPSPIPASVATFAGHPAIGYIDSVPELGLAPTGQGWESYNDVFGAGLSVFSTYMAVGAPWGQFYGAGYGIGYVAVYVTCCSRVAYPSRRGGELPPSASELEVARDADPEVVVAERRRQAQADRRAQPHRFVAPRRAAQHARGTAGSLPRTAVRGRTDVAARRTVLRPLVHVADRVVQPERIRIEAADRRGEREAVVAVARREHEADHEADAGLARFVGAVRDAATPVGVAAPRPRRRRSGAYRVFLLGFGRQPIALAGLLA